MQEEFRRNNPNDVLFIDIPIINKALTSVKSKKEETPKDEVPKRNRNNSRQYKPFPRDPKIIQDTKIEPKIFDELKITVPKDYLDCIDIDKKADILYIDDDGKDTLDPPNKNFRG